MAVLGDISHLHLFKGGVQRILHAAKVSLRTIAITRLRLTVHREPRKKAHQAYENSVAYELAYSNTTVDTWAVVKQGWLQTPGFRHFQVLLACSWDPCGPLTVPVSVTLLEAEPSLVIAPGDYVYLSRFEFYVDGRYEPSLRCRSQQSSWYVWSKDTSTAHVGGAKQCDKTYTRLVDHLRTSIASSIGD